MNSRSGVNETNLVNFPADLTELNQLETKDGILSFSFDHIYACHSDSSDRRPTLHLDKEVEISTQCVVADEEELLPNAGAEISRLTQKLTASENQNKQLKDLLIYHLDLIQQQNVVITKREKLFQSLKQENETLKCRLNRMDRRVTLNQRHSTNPPPLVHVAGIHSTVTNTETCTSQIMVNSLTELYIPESRPSTLIFDSDILSKPKNFSQESLIQRNSDRDVSSYLSPELGSTSVLDSKSIASQDYTMIESKPSFIKQEIKTDNSVQYTITGNRRRNDHKHNLIEVKNPIIIQRSRRRTTGTGSMSRVNRARVQPQETASNLYEDDKNYDDRNFTVNKKSKMINTYGKCSRSVSNVKRSTTFTGSLSDRLQLIDTTPTGEDPYQLGEAEMREQSPIPKLMLQKTNHGRMKVCNSSESNSTITSSRRIYDTPVTDRVTQKVPKIKVSHSYHLPNTYMHPSEIKKEEPDTFLEEAEMDIVKTETEIDWRIYDMKPAPAASLCDFSYGETSNNLSTNILDEYELFGSAETDLYHGGASIDGYNVSIERHNNRRGDRTTSLVVPPHAEDDDIANSKDKGGRKRALSTTGLLKSIKGESTSKASAPKQKIVKGKAQINRGKKSPLPGIETKTPYHTQVGDPDISWYLGLDPEIKPEDIDPPGTPTESTVEVKIFEIMSRALSHRGVLVTLQVPRWREKGYSSIYTLEGTENLDDKVFEKRHSKLEAEERRQLRWHMRRIREQRQVERLKQRQRDLWSPAPQLPSTFTVWQQPQRDARFIEITDTLPVAAFGEPMPALPESDFMLPWVRTSKALKRSKRSKTLH